MKYLVIRKLIFSEFVFEMQVSEKAIDYKIWMTLFGQEIPYKPTYLPNTKLARLVNSAIYVDYFCLS